MKKIFLITIVLLQALRSVAQMGLGIGDTLPDFTIPELINVTKSTANTSQFRDRLLIIDFWATNCSGCVLALPKMEALQKQFGDRVKILPVTNQPKALVSAFWKANSYTKNLSLPSVVGDKIFQSYFKHRTIPHEVWVYKGKVIGITGPDYVDAANIKRILAGEAVNWPVKNDFYVFDSKKPLFDTDPDQIDAGTSFKYAAISDYREGVNSEGLSGGSGIVRDAEKKTVRSYFLNQPIFTSYVLAWSGITGNGESLVKPTSASPNEVVWEVDDRSLYVYEPKFGYMQDWARKNSICFESVYPDSGQTDVQVYRTMVRDLDALLGLKVRWERRSEKVLVLSKTGAKAANTDTGAVTGKTYTPATIAYQLNQQAANPYAFDESGSGDKLKLDIVSWTDIGAIRKALVANGFELREEERLVDKLVFTQIRKERSPKPSGK